MKKKIRNKFSKLAAKMDNEYAVNTALFSLPDYLQDYKLSEVLKTDSKIIIEYKK